MPEVYTFTHKKTTKNYEVFEADGGQDITGSIYVTKGKFNPVPDRFGITFELLDE